MSLNEEQLLRQKCVKLAVDSGADCSCVVEFANEYSNFILTGIRSEALVIEFPALRPVPPDTAA